MDEKQVSVYDQRGLVSVVEEQVGVGRTTLSILKGYCNHQEVTKKLKLKYVRNEGK